MKADDTKSAEPSDTHRNTTYVCGKWKPREKVEGLSFMISQSEDPDVDPLQSVSLLTAPLPTVWVKLGLKTKH